jgi:hypothetical protein
MKGDSTVRLSSAAYGLVTQRALDSHTDRRTVASRAILTAFTVNRLHQRLTHFALTFIGGLAFGYLIFWVVLP